MTTTEVDLQHARRVAVAIAEEAGVLIFDGFAAGVEAVPKGDFGDVVTNLDVSAEQLILQRLRAEFPGHQIIAEESGVHAATAGGSWTWLVDPLDGTNNVAIGLPAFVVGLALCFETRPVVGVVHDPVTRQTWSAVRGSGAVGPAGPLRPVPRDPKHGPVLGWTQGHGVARTDENVVALKLVLERHAYRLLQMWAPLVCWVMLARGHIDGFVGYHAEAVDLPAGSIIAEEAGLAIVSLDGSVFVDGVTEAERRSFVAGPPAHLDRLLAVVEEARVLAPSLGGLTDPLIRSAPGR